MNDAECFLCGETPHAMARLQEERKSLGIQHKALSGDVGQRFMSHVPPSDPKLREHCMLSEEATLA